MYMHNGPILTMLQLASNPESTLYIVKFSNVENQVAYLNTEKYRLSFRFPDDCDRSGERGVERGLYIILRIDISKINLCDS